MLEKGCVFEFKTEYQLWLEFLNDMTEEKVSKQLLEKLAKETLNLSINNSLNSQLAIAFRSNFDLMVEISELIENMLNCKLSKTELNEIDEFIYEVNIDITNRLKEIFYATDNEYALWNVKPLTNYITLVEYQGDYRILEWHDNNGIPYKQNIDVRYEFRVDSIHNQLKVLLAPHKGKYAGEYFHKCLDFLVRVIIEDSVIFGEYKGRVYIEDIRTKEDFIEIIDFANTRKELQNYFPLMSLQELEAILVGIETIINNDVIPTVNATITDLGNIKSWSIINSVLTICVDREIKKVDFKEKFIGEIKANIANGDWVPSKLRAIAEL